MPDSSGRSNYRAGIHGGKAIYDRLEAIVDARALRGWSAQVRYLTASDRRRAVASEQFGARRLTAWLRGPDTPGGAAPSAANQARIRELYRDTMRQNMVPVLKRMLNNDGDGTLVEVFPAEDVEAQSQGELSDEEFTIFDWDEYVDAWAEDDLDAMYDLWEADADDNLYGGNGAYYFVSGIGF